MATHKAVLTAKDLGLIGEDEESLDVLDLPQLYTKPSARVLLSTLADISSEPPSWDATPRNGTPRSGTPRSPLSGANTPLRRKRKVKSEGLPSYLTKIISSPLIWIENDDDKELIWEAASKRLSERSGRTAMGAITRSFMIPLSLVADIDVNDDHTGGAVDDHMEIQLHEPALTADNLGLKTWASSYLLAKRLTFLRASLPELRSDSVILELGAGTGLVGLAAAAVFKTRVILTDLPDIVPNLERNARDNAAVIATCGGGSVDIGTLDWSEPAAAKFCHGGDDVRAAWEPHSFPLILIADPIYSSDHPRLLAQAVEHHLARDSDARVVVELPLREAFGAEREDFRTRLRALGLEILQEGEEVGFDDWTAPTSSSTSSTAATVGVDEEDDRAEVRCWWTVWAWQR